MSDDKIGFHILHMINTCSDIYKYRYLLKLQVINNIKLNLVNTWLSALWLILEPLILMSVYYFIVVTVFDRGGPGYHLFVLSALLGWYWFAKSLSRAVGSIRSHAAVIQKCNFPLCILIIAPVIAYGFYALIGFLIVMLLAEDFTVVSLIEIVPIMVVQGLFTIGIGTFLGVLNVYTADVKRGLAFFLRFWMYMSPVLYGVDRIADANLSPLLKQLYFLNPFTFLLPAYRDSLLYGKAYPVSDMLLWLGVSALLLIVGMWFLNKSTAKVKRLI